MEQKNKIPRVTFEIEGDSLRVRINEKAASDRAYAERQSRAIDDGAIFREQYARDWNRLQREATIRLEYEPGMTDLTVKRLIKIGAIRATEDGIEVGVSRWATRPAELLCIVLVVSAIVVLAYVGLKSNELSYFTQAKELLLAVIPAALFLALVTYFMGPRHALASAIRALEKRQASAVQAANSSAGTEFPATQQTSSPSRHSKSGETNELNHSRKVIYALAKELSKSKPTQFDFSDLGAAATLICNHVEEMGEVLTRQTAIKNLKKAIESVGGRE